MCCLEAEDTYFNNNVGYSQDNILGQWLGGHFLTLWCLVTTNLFLLKNEQIYSSRSRFTNVIGIWRRYKEVNLKSEPTVVQNLHNKNTMG